jgi:hypothetical protein
MIREEANFQKWDPPMSKIDTPLPDEGFGPIFGPFQGLAGPCERHCGQFGHGTRGFGLAGVSEIEVFRHFFEETGFPEIVKN